jgi:hypothetical protein
MSKQLLQHKCSLLHLKMVESPGIDFLQFAHKDGELVLYEKEEEIEEEEEEEEEGGGGGGVGEEDGGEGGRGSDLGMLEETDLKIGFSKHSSMVGRESNDYKIEYRLLKY